MKEEADKNVQYVALYKNDNGVQYYNYSPPISPEESKSFFQPTQKKGFVLEEVKPLEV